MGVEVKMPRLSQTTDEVRFIRWLVHEGDTVKKGDSLCEVETDKVTMEVESFTDGTVQELITQPDTVVDAGTVIAVLAGGEGKAGRTPHEGKKRETDSGMAVEGSQKIVGKREVRATPLVQNIAKKRGIDLHLVQGTGPDGLITRRDLDFVQKTSGSGISMPSRSEKRRGLAEEVQELTRAQAAVARNMVRSKSNIPHYYLKTTVCVNRVVELLEQSRKSADGKLSMYSLFISAAAKALNEVPELNGFFRGDRFVLVKDVHVGFAVESGEELFVPVVRDADRKSIDEIDRDVKLLSARARRGKLEPEDIRDGTFTVTNLGVYPVDEFYAIINYPQIGILAMGTIRKTIVIDDEDAMKIGKVCTMTGSFDHRCINGARGAKFLQAFKRIMEGRE